MIWRFRLVETGGAATSTSDGPLSWTAETNTELPSKVRTTITRIVRDTAKARMVKALYNYTCQVCGIRLEGVGGPYAEAAHVRPLGAPHNGPDTTNNLICLCPNHHVLFDLGGFTITDDHKLIGIHGKLTVQPNHKLKNEYLEYHRSHYSPCKQD